MIKLSTTTSIELVLFLAILAILIGWSYYLHRHEHKRPSYPSDRLIRRFPGGFRH